MTSRLALPVEGLHDVEPVGGVDPQQRQQNESNGAALAGDAGLDIAPQGIVDVAQGVLGDGHAASACKEQRTPSRPSRGGSKRVCAPPVSPQLTGLIDNVIVPVLVERLTKDESTAPSPEKGRAA